MDALIQAAYRDAASKPELIRSLIKGHVVIIASWDSPDSRDMTIQDFVRDGEPFIPFFSDGEHFSRETAGSGFEDRGVSIDANLFASMLCGTETLVLNPGSSAPVEFAASEFKAFVDSSRLPR